MRHIKIRCFIRQICILVIDMSRLFFPAELTNFLRDFRAIVLLKVTEGWDQQKMEDLSRFRRSRAPSSLEKREIMFHIPSVVRWYQFHRWSGSCVTSFQTRESRKLFALFKRARNAWKWRKSEIVIENGLVLCGCKIINDDVFETKSRISLKDVYWWMFIKYLNM